jgi:excisionase family DNA binding protein
MAGLVQYRIGEVAKRLNVSVPTVRQFIIKKKLPTTFTEGGHIRIAHADLVKFIRHEMLDQGATRGRAAESMDNLNIGHQKAIPQTLTIPEASDYLGLNPHLVRKLCRDGAIPCFITPGGHYRITTKACDNYMEHQEQQAKELFEKMNEPKNVEQLQELAADPLAPTAMDIEPDGVKL